MESKVSCKPQYPTVETQSNIPIFLIDPSNTNSKDHFIGRESKVRHLETVVQELPPISKQKFFQLHDCKRKKGEDLTNPSLHLLPGCEKSCEGIFRTNNFCLGKLGEAEHHGVFSTLSRHPSSSLSQVFERKFNCCLFVNSIEHRLRVNHSCVPNAETSWKSELNMMELVATRNISQGEEVTICYLNKVIQGVDTSTV